MTISFDTNGQRPEPGDPPLDELLSDVLNLVNKIVDARLDGGELARRRERIKANVATPSVPGDSDAGIADGAAASIPLQVSANADTPNTIVDARRELVLSALREAERIRDAARQAAEREQEGAHRRAADTVAAARREAEQIHTAAQQKAGRYEDAALKRAARTVAAARWEAAQIVAAARRKADQILGAATEPPTGSVAARGDLADRPARRDDSAIVRSPEGRARPEPGDPAAEARALVERAQEGDHEAFNLIYNRYMDVVFRFIYFRVGNRQLAEDLTSDTFLRALKRIGSFTRQGRDLRAWLVTIARNLVADHFKSGRYRLEITTGDVLDADKEDRGPEGTPEAAVMEHIRNVTLLTAIKQLDPEQQECIVLRFLHGFSVAETAQIMGKNEGAIKALQYRTVRALARLLPGDFRSGNESGADPVQIVERVVGVVFGSDAVRDELDPPSQAAVPCERSSAAT